MKKLQIKNYVDFWQEAIEDCGHIMIMEDGAPCHQGIASARRDQLKKGGWESWRPESQRSNSPDLNPIENIWHMLKCAVRNRDQPPRTEEELAQALIEEWEQLDMNKINEILLTMPEQLAAVKKANGGAISYQFHSISQ